MKTLFSRNLLLLASLLSVGGMASASANLAKGLLVYSDTSHYPEVCEYTSLVIGPVYARVRRADGGSFQIITTGSLTPVEYPSADPTQVTEAAARENLAALQELRERYPHLAARLARIETKWANALAFARQIALQPARFVPVAANEVDGRYAGMPRDALTTLTASATLNSPETASTPALTAPAIKKDPFAGFGGTALDQRKGFISDRAATPVREVDSEMPVEPESASLADFSDIEDISETTPALSEQDLASLQATLRKLLGE